MRYPPINPHFPHLLHGGDYNPEQWIDTPGIWEEDLRLMKLAHINAVSLGIFSWASLEPEEGKFTFDWLDRVMDNAASNGQRVILATPSGGKPHWMALKYEEIRRCDAQGIREPQRHRANHCPTSPIYREKVSIINMRLAERYKEHPALHLWHLSNEYGGYCYCPLCIRAFQGWLEDRYGTVKKMNAAFWAVFWSHTYASFDQVSCVDDSVHGLELAWKRFMTDQVASFILNEAAPLRRLTPNIPVTSNFMGTVQAYDYWKLAGLLDVVSWDSYPRWHGGDAQPARNPGPEDWQVAMDTAFVHDIYRAMKGGKPWILMESTPSVVNWQRVSRPKRPGMHRLGGMQAVAHGSDSVMYFQFRQSRGTCEKFHGAVVSHAGHEHTRVFRDVAQLGEDLEKLDAIVGTTTRAEVALIYDWENNWAIGQAQGPRNVGKEYLGTCLAHYQPFWKRGVPVDVIDSVRDFSKYKIVVAPMLHMLRPGVAERIERFVEAGGTFVATYLTGMVDEDDLCFLGGFPGPLRKVLGIWMEENEVLADGQEREIRATPEALPGLPEVSRARHYCDVIHAEGAAVLATYGQDFYAGSPAVTRNSFGKGTAYYIASRNDEAFTDGLMAGLIEQAGIRRVLEAELPEGVSVRSRTDGVEEYLFVMNFNPVPRRVALEGACHDMLAGKDITGTVELPAYGAIVARRAAGRGEISTGVKA
jgi:beta-galactosidase